MKSSPNGGTMAAYLSSQRMKEAETISAQTGVPISDVYEALDRRRGIPRFALEYIKNKNLSLPDNEKFPLWNQYWEILHDSKIY